MDHYGWICPRCSTVYAPWVQQCNCPPPSATQLNVPSQGPANIDKDKLIDNLRSYIDTLNIVNTQVTPKPEPRPYVPPNPYGPQTGFDYVPYPEDI